MSSLYARESTPLPLVTHWFYGTLTEAIATRVNELVEQQPEMPLKEAIQSVYHQVFAELNKEYAQLLRMVDEIMMSRKGPKRRTYRWHSTRYYTPDHEPVEFHDRLQDPVIEYYPERLEKSLQYLLRKAEKLGRV
jgi:hypothetical protein